MPSRSTLGPCPRPPPSACSMLQAVDPHCQRTVLVSSKFDNRVKEFGERWEVGASPLAPVLPCTHRFRHPSTSAVGPVPAAASDSVKRQCACLTRDAARQQ